MGNLKLSKETLDKLSELEPDSLDKVKKVANTLIDNRLTKAIEARNNLIKVTHDYTIQRDGENMPISANFAKRLTTLIQQPHVKSVSAAFGGLPLWRILVAEQSRRRVLTGLPAQEAFELNGPDWELGRSDLEELGGYIHIPYEGMCSGDLVMLPYWRLIYPEYAGEGGSLAEATRLGCLYLITPIDRDFGEFACATREIIDDWVIYTDRSVSTISAT